MANCVKCGRVLPGFSFGKKLCSWCVQHEAAQRGLEPDDAVQRVEPPPWQRPQSTSMIVTQVLFGINVAVFLGMLFAGVSIDHPAGQDLVRWGANFGPLTLNGQYWRLLTCVFVHGGLLHLAFNMFSLWNLGPVTESIYGHWTFAVVYLLAGVGGSLGSVIWNPNVLSVGASGAIFGIVGLLIASYYLGELSIIGRYLVIFCALSLIWGATSPGIDNAAHIGGLISGLLLGALIAKGAPDRDNPGQRIAILALGLLLIGGGAAWWLRSHDYMRHMQRGAGFLAESKTDQAIAEFQSVLRQRPDFPLAHFQLARAYGLKGDFPNAETEFKRVLELNPQSKSTYYNLGYVYLEEKKLPQARETFQRLLAMSPDSADPHFGLGAVAIVEERFQDAVHEYQAAAQIEPELEGVYYNLGRAQIKLGQIDDAVASFKKEIEESGDDYDAEIALANAYEAKGMKKEAAAAREKAAELTGKH